MLKTTLSILAVLLCTTVLPRLDARVIVVKKKAELNPTVYFSGVPGNAKLSGDIRTFLGVCGWFDLTNDAAKADYTVAAAVESGKLVIRLYQSKTPVAAWQFPLSSDTREVAKAVVDTIIERAFAQLKIRGFCRSRIAFTAESAPGIRNVFVCDIDGNNVRQITNYRSLNVEPSWSPSGRSIYFSKYNRSGIDIVETTLAKPRRSRILSSFRGINTGSAISPDGNYMAVILSPDHQVDLYLLGMRKKIKKRLTRGIAVEASPCWSPDSRRIAFVSDRQGNPRIFICNADGSGVTPVPTVGIDAVTPAWSADDKIAYATRLSRSSGYVLAVYDMKTGKNTVVTKGGGSWESPGWAADNRQVICKRILNGKSSLWVVDTRSGREQELLRTGNELFDPAWSPCTAR